MTNNLIAKQRNPAIELYRVLLMFLIVLHHSAYHGYWSHAQGLDAAWPSVYWIFTVLIVWHVDGFLSITGWFGTRFSLVRFGKLWGMIAFYSVFSVLYAYMTEGRLSFTDFAGGWFGRTYMYFLFLSPMLNAAIDELISGNRKVLLFGWVLFDVAFVLNWVPYNLFSFVRAWGFDGCSIMTFVTVYVNVRLLKISGLYTRVLGRGLLLIAVLFLLSIPVLKFIGGGMSYNSPFVMAMAIALLIAFGRIKHIPKQLERIISVVSPLMFGVYIIHDTTSFGRLIYLVPQNWLVNTFACHPIVIILMSAVFCFVVCVLIESMRRVACHCFSDYVLGKIQTLDRRIGFS